MDKNDFVINGSPSAAWMLKRIAFMLADGQQVAGPLCLGYPFLPPNKTQSTRTAYLHTMRTPTLICQGERDIFDNREEFEGYCLPSSIHFYWLKDGDHSFKPRKSAGITVEENRQSAMDNILAFTATLA